MRARNIILAFAGLAALTLAGCGASSGGYSDLERDREPGDELPVIGSQPDLYDDVDEESSRLVGEHEGADVWLMKSDSESSAHCLLVYDEPDFVMGCGSLVSVYGADFGTFSLNRDGEPIPEGAVAISENVHVTGGPDAE